MMLRLSGDTGHATCLGPGPGRPCLTSKLTAPPARLMESPTMTPSVDRTSPASTTPMARSDPSDAVHPARPARHRLGPLVSILPLDRPVMGRVYAAGLAAGAAALLIVAASLTPDGRYLGTHRQLKLSPHPCGFITMTGFPCPTCGMTTAFAYTVRGQFIEAARAQLAGFLLAIATAGVGAIAAVALVTGRRPALNWYRVHPTRLVWWLAALLVGAWAAKILLGLADGSLPVR